MLVPVFTRIHKGLKILVAVLTAAWPFGAVAADAAAAADDLASAPLPGAEIDVSRWTQMREIRLERAGVHAVELDFHALAGSANQGADLRLVREGRQVPYLIERPPQVRELALGLSVEREHSRAGHSRWRLTLPAANLPLARLTLQTGSALFKRQLTLSEPYPESRRREDYRQVAVAEWHRRPGDGDTLTVPLALRAASDHLMLDTNDGDNPPLVLLAARAAHPVMRLVFRAEPGVVTLHYGNPRALTADYDVAVIADQLLGVDRLPARLEPPREPPRGLWSDLLAGRLSLLFWGVLAIVTVTLLMIVRKLLPNRNL